MIRPVSFGSTYKTEIHNYTNNLTNEFSGHMKIKDMAKKNDFYFTFANNSYEDGITSTTIAPDKFDKDIESVFLSKGIKFKKLETAELLKPASIISRTVKPGSKNENMFMVTLNSDKLENLLENQKLGNICHCQNMYNQYFKEDAMNLLKSGNPIPAVTFYITPLMADSVSEYVSKFGADKLNKDSLILNFVQNSDDPNHCLYFAMKDLAMKNIPVYVNEQTYEIGAALGIWAHP